MKSEDFAQQLVALLDLTVEFSTLYQLETDCSEAQKDLYSYGFVMGGILHLIQKHDPSLDISSFKKEFE